MSYKEPKKRTCSKCGKTLPITDFGIIPTGQSWKEDWCLECRTEWVQNKKSKEHEE